MKNSILLSSAACAVLAFGVSMPTDAAAQDYAMYETQYVKVLPGHSAAMNEAMAAHNKAFHAEGPYAAAVQFVVNGPRAGQLVWVMGPGTWTTMDSRPAGELHDTDWADKVLAHGEAGLTEYWTANTDLSYTPETPSGAAPNLFLVRFFEVADNALFVKVQGQIRDVQSTQNNPRARTMFQKQFLSNDGRDWAMVVPYERWADLDQDGGDTFQAAFVETHGQAAWSTFLEEFAAAVVSRTDEWRQIIPELSGPEIN
jgi:hypothetical protein